MYFFFASFEYLSGQLFDVRKWRRNSVCLGKWGRMAISRCCLPSLTLLKDAEAIAKAHIWYFRAVETVLNRLQHKSKWQWQNQKWPSWSLHEELCFTVSWNNRDVTCTDAYYMFSVTISPTPDTVMQLFLPLNLSLLDSNN